MSALAKLALFITAAGLIVGMMTMNGRVLVPLNTRPVLYQAAHSVQRSDLLVVLPSSIKRSEHVTVESAQSTVMISMFAASKATCPGKPVHIPTTCSATCI